MHARARRAGTETVFSFWGCGDGYGDASGLLAGGGLLVSRAGTAANHHFLIPIDYLSFRFEPGDYVLDVSALVVGRRRSVLLSRIELSLSDELAAELGEYRGVLFERTIHGKYVGHRRGY